MPRETVTRKGLRYIAERRLIIRQLDAHHVVATCRGDSGSVHQIRWWGSWWSDRGHRNYSTSCPHVTACKYVVAIDVKDAR